LRLKSGHCFGRGGDGAHGLVSASSEAEKLRPRLVAASGEAEIAPVGWSLLRARWRWHSWAGLCFRRGGEVALEGWLLLRARQRSRSWAGLCFGRGGEVAPEGWSLLWARWRSRSWAGLCFGRGEEVTPEGWSLLRARQRLRLWAGLCFGRGGYGAHGLVCACHIRRPIVGWQAACVHCSRDVITLLRSDVIAVLSATVLCCHDMG
jgi:hypothetical protein